ncbi:MAG: DUF423 domain-containing protein [Bacteroidetes bacterium]|nr:DUF423 domain-containing protein [Bacteroidota bacterium]
MLTGKKIAVYGAILSGLAVVLGAFGAHALKEVLTPERLETYKTAVSYLEWHALALLGVGILLAHTGERLFRLAAITLLLGMLFFSGSLFVLVGTDIGWLGAITPFGGVLFIASWMLVALGLHRGLKN